MAVTFSCKLEYPFKVRKSARKPLAGTMISNSFAPGWPMERRAGTPVRVTLADLSSAQSPQTLRCTCNLGLSGKLATCL